MAQSSSSPYQLYFSIPFQLFVVARPNALGNKVVQKLLRYLNVVDERMMNHLYGIERDGCFQYRLQVRIGNVRFQ